MVSGRRAPLGVLCVVVAVGHCVVCCMVLCVMCAISCVLCVAWFVTQLCCMALCDVLCMLRGVVELCAAWFVAPFRVLSGVTMSQEVLCDVL